VQVSCANTDNLPGLNNLLISLLQILQRSDQPSELKLVISLFTKMVYCWGGDGQVHANVQVPFRPINKKKMQKEFKKSPLNGFNEFIYAHILPESFRLPLGPRIALEKGQSQSILNEIAALHKSALSSLGSEYLGYLKDYLTSISCPETTTVQFISTLQDEKQDFKKYLKVSFFYLDVFSNCTELTIAHLSLTF
jgi:exportin-T